ncbi:MAG TPA: UDP-N-acetylglucosamine 2-epimerase (non-hydrolyzing) [Pyrinomonadaceae bacterium]|nr:UDP-N-acetylglucosamine 2-epimerase (non-hydrolyzing) [Pyrinomonadaceae bacterium]
MPRPKIVSIVGTRPEVIKMAPVIMELERRSTEFEHFLVTTSQHREMLISALAMFGLKPDFDLDLMQDNQTLGSFASRSLMSLSNLLGDMNPQFILIQGDTTTVMTAGLAAFYLGIGVGHVEAGLRSFQRNNPFPEEINRRIAGAVADLHFAPTAGARENLLREGVSAKDIFVTGNTIVDALQAIPPSKEFEASSLSHIDFKSKRLILVTAHRRENHGPNLRSICAALKGIVSRFEDVEIVYPVHLNPNVRTLVYSELDQTPRVHLTEPVSYRDLLEIMRRCFLILTDSGGIQEEAVSFHKPVLVLRNVTERPEVVEVGAGKVIGTDTENIIDEVSDLLANTQRYEQMASAINPFGDGQAASRIVDILAQQFRSPNEAMS